MQEAVQFLLDHGYAVLFALVFAEQIGLPLPAVPILLATGALASTGHFSFTLLCAMANPHRLELLSVRGWNVARLEEGVAEWQMAGLSLAQ